MHSSDQVEGLYHLVIDDNQAQVLAVHKNVSVAIPEPRLHCHTSAGTLVS